MSHTSNPPEEITFLGVTYTCPFADVVRPLTPAEARDLRDDLAARGVVVPVVVTDEREVLDGRNRLRLAAEMGLAAVPMQVLTGLTAEEKRALAEDLNVHRRQLSAAEKRQLVERRLRADPARSNSAIAAATSVSDKTIAAARKRLEATSEIPKLTATRGRDGRTRTATVKRPKSVPTPVAELPRNVDQQPRLFEIEDPEPPQRKPTPTPAGRSSPWKSELKGVLSRVTRCQDELKRMTRVKVADRTPDPVRQLAAAFRALAEELDRMATSHAA